MFTVSNLIRLSRRNVFLLRNMALRSFSSYPDYIPITMPALSPTMETGNISEWEMKEGDEIVPGDCLAQIETDKATVAMEANDEGILAKILVPDGAQEIPVGQLIGILVEDADDVDAFKDFKAPEVSNESTNETIKEEETVSAPSSSSNINTTTEVTSSSSQQQTQASSPSMVDGNRIKASPLAKREARDRNIDLSLLKGTGPSRRIVLADVLEYVPQPGQVGQIDTTYANFTDNDASNMRKVIAQRLTQAKQDVPHYYLTIDVTMDNLLKFRSKLNEISDTKLSVNDFLIKASALALMKVPEVNSSWLGDKIRQYNYADISVAVATDSGLITPIVQDADIKGLSTISLNTKDLIEKARTNTLQPHEYQGGTFTISNLGGFGVNNFTAIINPPQACILAVGNTEDKVVSIGKNENGEHKFAVQKSMKVTLSCDHRVVDGAVGANWLKAFKTFMEQPESMAL